MAENDDFLIQEVKAELERERLANLWKQYGIYVIAFALALVGLVGGVQYWKASTLAAAQKAGATYDLALSQAADKKYDEAIKGFEDVAKTGASGYAALADLQLAATQLDQDKPDDALKAFERAAQSGAETLITDFAKLQIAALKLGTADFTETQNRLNGLISDENPWRFNARELLGVAQLRSGRTNEARDTFSALLGERDLPPAMQERVQLMLTQILAAVPDKSAANGVDSSDAAKKDGADKSDAADESDAADKSKGADRSEAADKSDAAAGTAKSQAAKPSGATASTNDSVSKDAAASSDATAPADGDADGTKVGEGTGRAANPADGTKTP